MSDDALPDGLTAAQRLDAHFAEPTDEQYEHVIRLLLQSRRQHDRALRAPVRSNGRRKALAERDRVIERLRAFVGDANLNPYLVPLWAQQMIHGEIDPSQLRAAPILRENGLHPGAPDG